jgi:intracellular septation protein A
MNGAGAQPEAVAPAQEQPVVMEATGPGAVVRRAGPRLVRDALGPLAIFYAGWKLVGLSVGIFLAVAFGVAVYAHERRRGRPAAVVRVALVLVAIRATVGLSSGNARVYLAQEIAIDTLLGCVVLGSLRTRRPFVSWFTEEVLPLPDELRESDSFRHAMRVATTVWGVYFLLRALVRLAALLTLNTDQYVLVAALTDAPFLVALLAWSVFFTTATLRASPQWGPLIAAAETSSRDSE